MNAGSVAYRKQKIKIPTSDHTDSQDHALWPFYYGSLTT